jgi:hypothetical protein
LKDILEYRDQKERIMNWQSVWQVATLTGLWISMASIANATSESEHVHHQLLSGDRILLGTVEEVRSAQARIDTGEGQPRFIPMGVRMAKELPALKKGDRVEVTLNDQNLLVDVHLVGESSYHRVVDGQLAQPLVTGHDRAILRTTSGNEESHFIRPVARSKVASIPVGVDAIFLIDELDKIVDVTFGSKEAVHRAAELWAKKTPLKGNFERINGVIVAPLSNDRITIQSADGTDRLYEVHPFAQLRLSKVIKGEAVVLLVDQEGKVTDSAIPPGPSNLDQ